MSSDLDSIDSIPAAFFQAARRRAALSLYAQARIVSPEKRAWTTRPMRQAEERISRVAAYLKASGVRQGDRVAIISSSRPEWMEADIAILCCGAIVVSVYPSLADHEVGYILHDAGVELVFAENEEQVAKLLRLSNEQCPIAATEEHPARSVQLSFRRIVTFESVDAHPLVVHFDEALNYSECISAESLPDLKRSDLASLVYTSGTTGPPKGVMQTHGNHLSNVRQALQAGLVDSGASIMVFLPLAHSFAKLMGYLGFIGDCVLKFPAIPDTRSSKMDADSITRDIMEGSAEVVPIVPRILEKMQSALQQRAQRSGLRPFLLRVLLKVGPRVQAAAQEKKAASLVDKVLYLVTAPVRRMVRRRLFGPKFKYAISGGAKLNPQVNQFFAMIGIEVLEGYGLTETCVATNANRPGRNRIGTVGPVLAPDIELRIAADGEILFRGPNVAVGYYNRPAATRSAWDDEGWFHTGDTGSVDAQGCLRIEGRKKELIVTSYGKKVVPDPIEQLLKDSQYISHAVLLGEGRAYCTALLTLDRKAVKEWLLSRRIEDFSQLESDKRVLELIGREVERINADLASFEQIKRFELLNEDFSIENGLLTPTLKVKRREVAKRYQAQIERLYSGG